MNQSVLRRITPTTAALLRWWFGHAELRKRKGPSFHALQRDAILSTITAQEGMDVNELRRTRPVHRMALRTGPDQIWVVLALVVWQLLNRNDASTAWRNDPRFTRHFVIVEPHPGVRAELMNAFCGPPIARRNGLRDFRRSDIARLANLLVPEARRDEVLDFVRAYLCTGANFGRDVRDTGVIAITEGRVDALECLAHLPDAMVFDDETRPLYHVPHEHPMNNAGWRGHLRHFVADRRGFGVGVVFSEPAGFF